jgi:hypothetical protein
MIEISSFLLEVLNVLFCALQLANKNNPPMTTLRTGNENRNLGKFKMKFSCIGILQQPIGTLQIPSRVCKEFFKFATLMRKIPNELGSQEECFTWQICSREQVPTFLLFARTN